MLFTQIITLQMDSGAARPKLLRLIFSQYLLLLPLASLGRNEAQE